MDNLTRANGPITWFANNPVAANLLMLFIFVIGVLSSFTIRTELIPNEKPKTFSISTIYPSASPKEVESGITLKIEDAIDDITGIKKIDSHSNLGSSSIVVTVYDDADRDQVMEDAKARVDGLTTLPDDIESPVFIKHEQIEPAIQVQLHGNLDEFEAKKLAEQIRNEMLNQTIIKRIDIWGSRPYEVSVEIEERTLQKYGLTLRQVAAKIEAESLNYPSGIIKTETGNVLLRIEGQRYTEQEFENLPLKTTDDGSVIHLGDIARIEDGFVGNRAIAYFDGQYSLGLSISAVGSQDLISVAQAAKDFIAERRKTLPENVHLTEWADTSYYLNGRLQMMIKNMVLGGILVFILLALFMNLRIAFWVMAGLPVCYMGAFMMMPIEPFNLSLNMVSLFGLILVLGIIVDDAIVVAESVDQQVRKNGMSIDSVIEGTRKVAVPAIFGVLTTIAAFTPMLFVEGPQHASLFSIGFVVVVCLVFSLIESKLILPSHLASHDHGLLKFIRNSKQDKLQKNVNERVHNWIESRYKPLLRNCIGRRYLTLACFIGMLMMTSGLVAGGWVKYILFPSEPNDFLQVRIVMSEGTTEERTAEVIGKVKQSLFELEKDYQKEYGEHHYIVEHLYSYNSGDLNGFFLLEMTKSEDREVNSFEIIEDWRKKVGEVQDAYTLDFSGEIKPSSLSLSFLLIGDNEEQLRDASMELMDELRNYEGLSNFTSSVQNVREELILELKPRAVALGLTLGEIGLQVKEAFYGVEAQRFIRDNEEIRVLVRYPEEYRGSLKDLEEMYIYLADGRSIPLKELAYIKLTQSRSGLTKVDGEISAAVSAKADNAVLEPDKIRKDLHANFFPGLFKKYPEVSFKKEGISLDQQNLEDSMRKFFWMALLGVFILLAIPLKSYTQPLIIMSVIPFGIVGAIIGHFLLGYPLSLMSIFGIIALSGVVVNDSLIMVDFVNRAARSGLTHAEAVLEAGAKRFRAIILTTATTFAGVLPMIMETSLQAKTMVTMAVSLGFGIVFATGITLLLVPCLYMILEDLKTFIYRWGKLAS